MNHCAADSFDPKYQCTALAEQLLFISTISKDILSLNKLVFPFVIYAYFK